MNKSFLFLSNVYLAVMISSLVGSSSIFAQEESLFTANAYAVPFKVSPSQRALLGEREYYEKITKAQEQAAQGGFPYNEPTVLSWDERGFAHVGLTGSIWYPKMPAADQKFIGDWSSTRNYLLSHGFEIPKLGMSSCPWNNNQGFQHDFDNLTKSTEEINNPDEIIRKNDLLNFISFLKKEDVRKVLYELDADRLERALDPNSEYSMLKNLPPGKVEIINSNFYYVASVHDQCGNPLGIYALVDYCNFKGEGTAPTEHYNAQAWGLGRVLFEMESLRADAATINYYINQCNLREQRADIDASNLNPLELFVITAAKVLDNRIENNKIERNRIHGTPAYTNFIARYGDESALLTEEEISARKKAFENIFGLPYNDNSQYQKSLWYPHLINYLKWSSSQNISH
jgi:hypothetical protein